LERPWYEAAMAIYMVERVFTAPVTAAQFMQAGEKLGPCIQERDIKHLGSYLASDGLHSICMFESADAERLREANRTAGAPFERVWQADKL
jgi:hypothetical protein